MVMLLWNEPSSKQCRWSCFCYNPEIHSSPLWSSWWGSTLFNCYKNFCVPLAFQSSAPCILSDAWSKLFWNSYKLQLRKKGHRISYVWKVRNPGTVRVSNLGVSQGWNLGTLCLDTHLKALKRCLLLSLFRQNSIPFISRTWGSSSLQFLTGY